jgi:superfamily II DNA/RNA helicase
MRFTRLGRFFVGQKQRLSLPSFKEYAFHPTVLEVLEKKEFYTPSPIQDMSINEIRRNQYQNIVLIAPTGTGKTLSYCLPMIDMLKKEEETSSTAHNDYGVHTH